MIHQLAENSQPSAQIVTSIQFILGATEPVTVIVGSGVLRKFDADFCCVCVFFLAFIFQRDSIFSLVPGTIFALILLR